MAMAKKTTWSEFFLGPKPKKAVAKKATFPHQAQLSAVQKRKRELEKELAGLILTEQQLLQMKGGKK